MLQAAGSGVVWAAAPESQGGRAAAQETSPTRGCQGLSAGTRWVVRLLPRGECSAPAGAVRVQRPPKSSEKRVSGQLPGDTLQPEHRAGRHGSFKTLPRARGPWDTHREARVRLVLHWGGDASGGSVGCGRRWEDGRGHGPRKKPRSVAIGDPAALE